MATDPTIAKTIEMLVQAGIARDSQTAEVMIYQAANGILAGIPVVAHVNDRVEGAVYVGRKTRGTSPSEFGNPFHYNRRDGADALRTCLYDYLQWLVFSGDRLSAGARALFRLPKLRGAIALTCWCRRLGEVVTDANLCHADVLRYLLATYTNDEIEQMAARSLWMNPAQRPSIGRVVEYAKENDPWVLR